MIRQMGLGVLTYKKSVKFKNHIRFWNRVSERAWKQGYFNASIYLREIACELQEAFTLIKQGKPLSEHLKKRVKLYKNLKEFA